MKNKVISEQNICIRLKEKDRSFRCSCGCNVFHNFEGEPTAYYCNACNTQYEGTLNSRILMKNKVIYTGRKLVFLSRIKDKFKNVLHEKIATLEKVKLIIAGSRTITDISLLNKIMDKLSISNIGEVVSGKARGVDSLGEEWARAHKITIKDFPADWDTYKKSAGHIRNAQMAEYGDTLLLLWNGTSSGSASMLELAKKKGLKIYEAITIPPRGILYLSDGLNVLVNKLHYAAMSETDLAFTEQLVGDKRRAMLFFREALNLELLALKKYEEMGAGEPTLSILRRSAATLACDCRDFNLANKLITLALSQNPPAVIKEELTALTDRIHLLTD